MGEEETLCGSLRHTHSSMLRYVCVCVCIYTQTRHMETAQSSSENNQNDQKVISSNIQRVALCQSLILGDLGLFLHLEIGLHGTPATPGAPIKKREKESRRGHWDTVLLSRLSWFTVSLPATETLGRDGAL